MVKAEANVGRERGLLLLAMSYGRTEINTEATRNTNPFKRPEKNISDIYMNSHDRFYGQLPKKTSISSEKNMKVQLYNSE